MTPFARTARVLEAALKSRAFSAVNAEVGSSGGVEWIYSAGRVSFDHDAPAVTERTIFDLASLTKVLAAASLASRLISDARLDLDTRVATFLPGWTAVDRAAVTVRDLLEHSSGLPAYRPYFKTLSGRAAYQDAIAREPLECEPRTAAIYSDLGFILLGFILEDAGGAPLDAQVREWRHAEGLAEMLDFVPPDDCRSRIASTGRDSWRGRVLQGEVHDANAAALGGIAAHAGLFGTAPAVGEIARWWLAGLTGLRPGPPASFARRSTVPGSSRALGWDTMLPTSSCGTRFSSSAIGHTGFTGTSLWIDPERDLYAVLLSNYVISARERETIRQVRRAFHDAVIDDRTDNQP
ncbi:MAG: serine hydrolase domain-containing protein [Vicinamibacterales bacterium]